MQRVVFVDDAHVFVLVAHNWLFRIEGVVGGAA